MPKVVAAIDGSSHASNALVHATNLFGVDADYVLLSIVPPWSPAVAIGANEDLDLPGGVMPGDATHGSAQATMPFAPTPESVAATTEALFEYYRTAQNQAASTAGISAEHAAEEAKPKKRRIGAAICEAANEHGADVIVIGSHGSSYTGEVLLGSVSQHVVHHAQCPVLVVRPGD